ncbi:ATP-dependent DNA helicase PIF1-like [Temnothorax nylanderi]|uniref:ATP-dependent DNA helicase PIF1-like n=1 Tax=Temnothorax nylanderi TaxID=102681 RepID=UPI003A8B06CE
MRNTKPFGAKVILFAGDFRQNLPVVAHANRTAIIESTVKHNPIWKKVIQIKLKENMRTGEEREFANWLMELGEGNLTNTDGLQQDTTEIPHKFLCKGSLITEIFGEKITMEKIMENPDRAILCPKNEDTFKINDNILGLMEGEEKEYLSIDSIESEEEQEHLNFPTEFLNSVTLSGMPVHRLKLKVSAIIILLRNINSKKGLCNGTRLIVRELKQNLIHAEVMTGPARGEIVFLPRIDFIPSDIELPFKLKRRQFPIGVAFAMTINKAQGQTLKKVGIYLRNTVFAHGQLYVAFSRATKRGSVKIKIEETNKQGHLIEGKNTSFTKNVVYQEIW